MKIFRILVYLCNELVKLSTITFFLIILSIGAYALYDAYYVYDGAKLSDEILELKPEKHTTEFSLNSLKEFNENICAWIRIDDTNIDYPIVQGEDNTEYLSKDYKGAYATAGSIFMDYRNNRNFNDDYTIIYGHNMQANLMFSNLKKFMEEDFFNSHSSGELYTQNEIYDIEVICISRISAYEGKAYYIELYANQNNNLLLNVFLEKAIQKRDVNISAGNKLLLLSTCDVSGSNTRVVLLTKLTKKSEVQDSTLINNGDDTSLKILDKKLSNNPNNEKSFMIPIEIGKDRKIDISARKLILGILILVVSIIFAILFVRIIKLIIIKNNKHKNSK